MKTWDKGYKLDKDVERYTVGNDCLIDQELVWHDAEASIAHAKMLRSIGVLNDEELTDLVSSLKQIQQLAEQGEFKIKPEEEDCHTAIENFLIKNVGAAGKKIHTYRSRNDQATTAIRLYMKEKLEEIISLIDSLSKSIKSFANRNKETAMPGYTHMQKAMPSSVGMWAMAFTAELDDQKKLLRNTLDVINQNPLGSAAGYGLGKIEIDRELTTKLLGFAKVQDNPIYCINSRGKVESIVASMLSLLMLTLNKIATDLMLFTTAEFGFFSLPDEFLTGSSIMPQKKNYDVLEILRGKFFVVLGYELMLKGMISNLPSGYNRDVQLTKEPMINSFKIVIESVQIASKVFANLNVNKKNLEKAMTPELYATQKAHELVKEGMGFRDAYKRVAKELERD